MVLQQGDTTASYQDRTGFGSRYELRFELMAGTADT